MAAVAALILSRAVLMTDALLPDLPNNTMVMFYRGSPDEIRSLLVDLAWLILGTTGVVYSLLIVPLSVAAAQYGSRLLRVYLKDRTAQVVLGVFVGTITYCISSAMSIMPVELNPDMPQMTATVALLLCLTSFASMIFLIHHIGFMLQAPNLVAAASLELREVIKKYHPEVALSDFLENDQPTSSPDRELLEKVAKEGVPVVGTRLGYFQEINLKRLEPLVKQPGLVIQFIRKPGHFIDPGEEIARVWPAEAANANVIRSVQDACLLSNMRTPVQDIQFGINQLVEVALRAMSPAINDPFTAMTCLDHIGASLALYAESAFHKTLILNRDNGARVIITPVGLTELLDTTFNILRHTCRDNVEVMLTMLNTLETISIKGVLPSQKAELIRCARLFEQECLQGNAIQWDKQRFSESCDRLVKKLSPSAQ